MKLVRLFTRQAARRLKPLDRAEMVTILNPEGDRQHLDICLGGKAQIVRVTGLEYQHLATATGNDREDEGERLAGAGGDQDLALLETLDDLEAARGQAADPYRAAVHDTDVLLAGGLDDAGLVRAFQGCDCLCLPSIERTEAFGVVLLEAMYFGKPILSSRLEGSGMNWIVEDGVTGLKFEPANVDSLVAALRQMAADEDARRRMGAAGRAKFEANFSIEHSVDGLQAVYSDLPGPLK